MLEIDLQQNLQRSLSKVVDNDWDRVSITLVLTPAPRFLSTPGENFEAHEIMIFLCMILKERCSCRLEFLFSFTVFSN